MHERHDTPLATARDKGTEATSRNSMVFLNSKSTQLGEGINFKINKIKYCFQ